VSHLEAGSDGARQSCTDFGVRTSPASSLSHPGRRQERMSRQIEDGELCPSCGEIPIAFYGRDKAECPNCGEQLHQFDDSLEDDEDDDDDDDDYLDGDFDEE
jgi:hypothetical protein